MKINKYKKYVYLLYVLSNYKLFIIEYLKYQNIYLYILIKGNNKKYVFIEIW